MPFSNINQLPGEAGAPKVQVPCAVTRVPVPADIVHPSGDTSGWVEVVQNDGGLTGVVTPVKVVLDKVQPVALAGA